MPETSVVLPAPRSPLKATQSPGFRWRPRRRPRDCVSSAPRRSERRAGSTRSASRREDGRGENHFLQRDASVLEAPPVLVLVFVEIGGVYEIEVFLGDDVVLVARVRWKPESGGILDLARELRVAGQVRPELDAQIRVGLRVPVHHGR